MGNDEKASPFESKAQERTIGDHDYRVLPVGIDEGIPALVRLIKIASPLFGALTQADLPRLFEVLPTVLDDKDVLYFAELFGKVSFYANDGKWVPLISRPHNHRSLHFAGDYLQFLRWIIFNIEVNFGGFFGGVTEGLNVNAMMAKMKPATTTPTTGSTPGIGSSGG